MLSDAGVLQKVKSLVGWSAARGLSASSALDTTRVRLEAVSLQRVPAASRHEVYKGIAKGHYVFFFLFSRSVALRRTVLKAFYPGLVLPG